MADLKKSGVEAVPLYGVWRDIDVCPQFPSGERWMSMDLYLDNRGLQMQGKEPQADTYIGYSSMLTRETDDMCRIGVWGRMDDGKHTVVVFTGTLSAQAVRTSRMQPYGMYNLSVRDVGPCCYMPGVCGKHLPGDFLERQRQSMCDVCLAQATPGLMGETRRLVSAIKEGAYIPADDFGTYAKLWREGCLLNPESGRPYLSREDTERVARQTMSYVTEQADFFEQGSTVASRVTGRKPVTSWEILDMCCSSTRLRGVIMPAGYTPSLDTRRLDDYRVRFFANEMERLMPSNAVSGMQSMISVLSSVGLNVRTDALLCTPKANPAVIRETMNDLHADGVVSRQTWSEWCQEMSPDGRPNPEYLRRIQEKLSLVYLYDAIGLSDACMGPNASPICPDCVGTHEMIYSEHGLGESVQHLFAMNGYWDFKLDVLTDTVEDFFGKTENVCAQIEENPGKWLGACNLLGTFMESGEAYCESGFDLLCERDVSSSSAKPTYTVNLTWEDLVTARPDRALPEYENRIDADNPEDDTEYC